MKTIYLYAGYTGMLAILTGLAINHINEHLDAAGATIRENNAALDVLLEEITLDNTAFDRNIERLRYREEINDWPPDTLWVDLNAAQQIDRIALPTIDGRNAVVLTLADGTQDTTFYEGSLVLTIVESRSHVVSSVAGAHLDSKAIRSPNEEVKP